MSEKATNQPRASEEVQTEMELILDGWLLKGRGKGAAVVPVLIDLGSDEVIIDVTTMIWATRLVGIRPPELNISTSHLRAAYHLSGCFRPFRIVG